MEKFRIHFERRHFLRSSAAFALGVPLLANLGPFQQDKVLPTDLEDQIELCSPLRIFNSIAEWVKSSPSGHTNLIKVEGVRIKKSTTEGRCFPKDHYVSFFNGDFSYNPKGGYFQADFQQLFSDRFVGQQPFDKSKTDILNIKLFMVGQDVKVQYILKTWENHKGVFTAKCSGFSLIGYDPDGLNWVLNFVKIKCAD